MRTDTQTEMPKEAVPFDAMATLIHENENESFAGAFVIVPPNGEPPIELLLLTAPDPAMFWSMIKTKAEIAMQELAAKEQQALTGWNSRR